MKYLFGRELGRELVKYCSPTLAGLKTASLFRLYYDDEEQLGQCLREYGALLGVKGIKIRVLSKAGSSVLLYVFRPKKLYSDFENPSARRLLLRLGYNPENVEEAIDLLAQRISSSEGFPHEIGLFLGFPADDVEGFIENMGQNCKCSGYWKVYGDEKAAKTEFKKFDKCTRVYCRCYENGTKLNKLCVLHH